jgi:L-asparaginase II
MLLLAKLRGWPQEGYHLPGHPLQVEMADVMSGALGIDDLPTGVDGCGVPTFAAPLAAMALAFSRLPDLPGGDRVTAAMLGHPVLVGGVEAGDTKLMLASEGLLAKRGAEGLMCAVLPDGTGVAAKVEDGANRAAGPALASFLGIQELETEPVINSLCEEVGRIVPSQ